MRNCDKCHPTIPLHYNMKETPRRVSMYRYTQYISGDSLVGSSSEGLILGVGDNAGWGLACNRKRDEIIALSLAVSRGEQTNITLESFAYMEHFIRNRPTSYVRQFHYLLSSKKTFSTFKLHEDITIYSSLHLECSKKCISKGFFLITIDAGKVSRLMRVTNVCMKIKYSRIEK